MNNDNNAFLIHVKLLIKIKEKKGNFHNLTLPNRDF
jgi:hypothetical protein